jgi:hypothetical protein
MLVTYYTKCLQVIMINMGVNYSLFTAWTRAKSCFCYSAFSLLLILLIVAIILMPSSVSVAKGNKFLAGRLYHRYRLAEVPYSNPTELDTWGNCGVLPAVKAEDLRRSQDSIPGITVFGQIPWQVRFIVNF